MGQQRVSRQDLYSQVWSTPMRTQAPKYGLSDVGLAKICKRHRIPRPGLGYWAKKEVGRPVKQQPLRPFPGMEEIIIRMTEVHEQPKLPVDEAQQREAEEKIANENRQENQVIVSDALVEPHRLTEAARRHLEHVTTQENGILVPKAMRCLDIRVSKASVDRALRIMDALVKALETRRISVVLTGASKGGTQVTVLGETLSLGISETVTRQERESSKAARAKAKAESSWDYARREYDYTPTGLLSLHLEGLEAHLCRTWKDGKRRRLEEMLNGFLVGLMESAVVQRSHKLDNERREREHREAEKRRHELAMKQWEEDRTLKKLEEQAAAWNRARQIREYAEAMKQWASQRYGELDPNSELAQWIMWAFEQADRFDPLR